VLSNRASWLAGAWNTPSSLASSTSSGGKSASNLQVRCLEALTVQEAELYFRLLKFGLESLQNLRGRGNIALPRDHSPTGRLATPPGPWPDIPSPQAKNGILNDVDFGTRFPQAFPQFH